MQTQAVYTCDGISWNHGEKQMGTKTIITNKSKPDTAWLQHGQAIARNLSRQQWEIGDWLVEGCKKWERKAYGAAERIFPEYTRTTLRNLAYVARAVETSRRSDVLSWSHHEAVAAMKPDKQRELLAYAAEKRLSFAAFRRHLNALEQQRLDAEDAEWIRKLEAEERPKIESEEEKQARLERERQFDERERQFAERRQRMEEENRRRPELAKEIVHAGKRALALKRHPDQGGSNDAMAELNLVTEWLLRLIDKDADDLSELFTKLARDVA
jgi:hypothetical protein